MSDNRQQIPKMLVGTDDFQDLLLNSDLFVDKTMLIKAFIDNNDKVALITRPRRWGKSMNMDMIAKFLQTEVDSNGNILPEEQKQYPKLFTGGEVDLGFVTGDKKLIKPTKIADHPDIIAKYQGKYPVIRLNFKDVKGITYEEILGGIKDEITAMFEQHRYLLNSDKLNAEQKELLPKYFDYNLGIRLIKNSIKFLSQLLYAHFGVKPYVLIDEYDTPINTAYAEFYDKKRAKFNNVIKLFQGLFGAGLKTNPSLQKGLVTGILRVAKANIFSGMNNLGEDCLLDPEFAKYYGFTESEVEELIARFSNDTPFDQIKKWYNGYYMGDEIIYNPWSIMRCLSRGGVCDTYWVDSGGTQLLDKVLLSDKIQEELQVLLEGGTLLKRITKYIAFDEFETNSDMFYSLMLFAGYLNAKKASEDSEEQAIMQQYYLTVPNLELSNIYSNRIISWVNKKFNITSGSDYYVFVGLLTDQKIDQFFADLASYFINVPSFHDFKSERDYHNLMGGLFAPLVSRYFVKSNRESGLGRFDHTLIPKKPTYDTAFILEYKLAKNKKSMEGLAKEALAQINDNHYDAEAKTHPNVKKIIKIGMAFCGKEFRVVRREDVIKS